METAIGIILLIVFLIIILNFVISTSDILTELISINRTLTDIKRELTCAQEINVTTQQETREDEQSTDTRFE